MKELAKIKQLLNSLSKKELNDLVETIRRETLIKDDIEIESIIKSGQINENIFAFLTANATYIYQNDKLVTVNDRYAISTISSCLNDIHISPAILSKLPKLEIVFNPLATERIYDGKFNTFTPSPYVLFSKDVKVRIKLDMLYLKNTYKHIYLLLKNIFRTDEYIAYFINWFSAIINTRQKMGVAFIIKGSQGTGKNFLFDHLIKRTFYVSDNAEYTLTIDNDRLRNRFNGGLEQSLFVCFNEIKGDFRDNATTADSMKSLITDSKIQIERKGKDSTELHTFFNSILFSNHAVPFQVEPGDRRFFVIETNNQKLDTVVKENLHISMAEYVKNFDVEANDFLRHIIALDFDIANARNALHTSEKEALISATTPRLARLAHLVKNQEIIALFNEFNELYTPNEMPLHLFNDSLKKFLNEVKKGSIATQSLKFAYKIYVSSKNDMTKINRDLTGEFGVSIKNSGFTYRKLNHIEFINIDIDELFKNSSLSDNQKDEIQQIYDNLENGEQSQHCNNYEYQEEQYNKLNNEIDYIIHDNKIIYYSTQM